MADTARTHDSTAGQGGPHSPGAWRRTLVLVPALLALAGFVDAVGLQGFGLFPAFLSGDVTRLGIAAAEGRGPRVAVLGGAVVIFTAGAFVGRLLRLRTHRRAPVLAVEAALLALAAAAAVARMDVGALACATAAMGAQTAVASPLLLRIPAPMGPVEATGAFARLGSSLADALAGGGRTLWPAQLLAAIALGAGAIGGGLCYGRAGLESLLPAAGAAALLATAVGLWERRILPPDPA